MAGNNESQCYFIQLQFDNYIDGDLSESQQETFLAHVHSCAECAHEFRYAQTIQDGLVDLPLLDCSETALAGIDKFISTQNVQSDTGWTDKIVQWFNLAPVGVRYAFPVLALLVIGLVAIPQLQSPDSAPLPTIADVPAPLSTTPVQYSPEDITQALQELNLAIEYLNEVSQRTESMVGGRFLMRPLRESLNASFERVRTPESDALGGDEI